ncbi:MAG: hypothetical protein LBE38_00795 [Deltaproteobacteria bacterium]|jgi:hypothetical protein|nr:hypothetical protein [Deltaproteobacteria bacterium]
MFNDMWLPFNYSLSDGSKIKKLLFSGNNWQIYDSYGFNNVLIAEPCITEKWFKCGIIVQSLFHTLNYGSKIFHLLFSDKMYALEPIDKLQPPLSIVDAMAVAVSFKESRKFTQNDSFHDAIYIEQYSRLLPTWTKTPNKDDKTVLGTWLTGGVGISIDSSQRLIQLSGWLNQNDLDEILEASGLNNQENKASKSKKISLDKFPYTVSLKKNEDI